MSVFCHFLLFVEKVETLGQRQNDHDRFICANPLSMDVCVAAENADEDANNGSGTDADEDEVREDDAAMAVDEPIPDAAPPPAGMVYKIGTRSFSDEPLLRVRHEGHHKILARAPDGSLRYFPQGALLAYYEWARAPRSLFTSTPLPDGVDVHVHRDGKRYRYRASPAAAWKDGGFGSLTPAGRRRFLVLGNRIYAGVLVCSAFWGERPGPEHGRYEAGHAHAVVPGGEPRDAAHQLSWLTQQQNSADTRRAGAVENPGKRQAIWTRPTNDAPAKVHASWATLCLQSVQRNGHAWTRFDSLVAAATTLGLNLPSISAVLHGSFAHTGNYTFEFDTVAEPVAGDRVQLDAKRDTFVTRDGRMLQRKTRLDGRQGWTTFTLTPASSGYIRVKTAYASLPGLQLLHRLVFRAFANDRIEAKIALARVRNAEIDEELTNPTLSVPERAELEREKNGLAYADFEIDHINGIKTDNRLANLEILTKLEHAAKTRGQLVVETAGPERDSTEIATFATIAKSAKSAGLLPRIMARRFKSGHAAIEYKDGTTRYFHKA